MNHLLSQRKFKLIVLWLLVLIGMILHFNYRIGEIFYGIDVTSPGADGTVPMGAFIIYTLFYHLPIICLLLVLYVNNKAMNILLLVMSILFLLSHGAHLYGELSKSSPDPSQLSLLSIVLLLSGMLSTEHLLYLKQPEN